MLIKPLLYPEYKSGGEVCQVQTGAELSEVGPLEESAEFIN
jgi:hypothetical protein